MGGYRGGELSYVERYDGGTGDSCFVWWEVFGVGVVVLKINIVALFGHVLVDPFEASKFIPVLISSNFSVVKALIEVLIVDFL